MDGEHEHYRNILKALERDISLPGSSKPSPCPSPLTVTDKARPALICSSLYFGYAAEMKDSCAGRINRFPLADYGQDRVLSCGSERMR